MANTEIVKLQFKRGPEAQLPTLDAGEPAITTDTNKLFVGDGHTNHQVALQADLNNTNTSLSVIPSPKPVIWLTDWWTDVDDVVAARILLWAERAGLVDVVGVVSTCANGHIAPSIDAFFNAEGRPNMPIGVDINATDFGGSPPYQLNLLANRHAITSDSTAESDVSLMRRALATATQPVDIIAVGYLNSLHNLLQSPADSISSLTGMQLATQKVGRLWVMAGNYPNGAENNMNRNARAITAAQDVCANWPTPITFLGHEVGASVLVGSSLPAAADDVLAKAYADYGVASGTGHAAWDPMTTLMACIGDPEQAGYYTVNGTNTVDASGNNTFNVNANGKHQFVVKKRTDNWYAMQIDRIINRYNWSGRKLGARQLPKLSRLGANTDMSNLLGKWTANDLAGNADGSVVYHIEDRLGKHHLRALSSEAPTYKQTINGLSAINFSGSNRMTSDYFDFTGPVTIYAKVLWSTLPASNQTVIGQDSTVNGTRLWHLKGVNGTQIQGNGFTSTGTGLIDTAAVSLAVNTWYVMTLVITASTVEVFLNGVSDGPTSASGVQFGSTPISLGCRNNTGAIAESFAGYMHEARIYNGAHSVATINSVINEMF